MNEAITRANLNVARYAEVTDRDGRLWTVHIVRNGDPRGPSWGLSKFYWYAISFNLLRRLIVRDRRWNVELMPGRLRDDLSESVVCSVEPNRSDALEAAVRLVRKVQSGPLEPS